MPVCISIGYSLQLLSQSDESNAYPYKGEWMSRVIPMTNDWLCISLNLSVPVTFHVTADLVTNANTKTVYTVENIVGETLASDMVTVFEVQVDAVQSRFSQLVVYVSEGAVVRNVDIQNEQCNNASKYITRSYGSLSLLLGIPAMSVTCYLLDNIIDIIKKKMGSIN